MTAPARPQLRLDRPATREQLLILADRAERGPLTAAEAHRLRQGIAAMCTRHRSTAARYAAVSDRERRGAEQLAAVRALVRASTRRGRQTVRIATLSDALQEPL